MLSKMTAMEDKETIRTSLRTSRVIRRLKISSFRERRMIKILSLTKVIEPSLMEQLLSETISNVK
jgi:hypothetical protein